jgi:hypothetical protein
MFYTSWVAPKWARGKSFSKQIAIQIFTVLGKKVEDPICQGWESGLKEGTKY